MDGQNRFGRCSKSIKTRQQKYQQRELRVTRGAFQNAYYELKGRKTCLFVCLFFSFSSSFIEVLHCKNVYRTALIEKEDTRNLINHRRRTKILEILEIKFIVLKLTLYGKVLRNHTLSWTHTLHISQSAFNENKVFFWDSTSNCYWHWQLFTFMN